MKNSFFTLGLVLGLFSLLVTSCESTEPDITQDPDQYGGTYKVYLDNTLVKEGSTDEVGLLADLVTMGSGDAFGIILSEVPVSVGETVNLNDDYDEAAVIISGLGLLLTDDSEEFYFSTSGTIKRESKTKISFQGYCVYLTSADSITFSGVLESEAFKLIKEDVY